MSRRYDLVVVGGGIHGAGIAQAAAAGGHSVLVLERTGLAAGTSSRSTKLIHGGLRYLETRQLGLVRECLHERALLLRLAPELVRLVPFHLPVYRHTRRRPARLRLGLSLYALLALGGPGARFGSVAKRDWEGLDGLDCAGLQTVFRYWDAQTDDAALTRAVMRSARELGAELALPARFIGAECRGDGVVVRYETETAAHEVECRALVNAAGPWADEILARVLPQLPAPDIELVQGTHIVLDAALAAGAYTLEAPRDGRVVFALPWRGRLMVGTTETPYRGDPAGAAPLAAEIGYLRETLAHHFPAWGEHPPALLDAFAGLRVLPAGPDAAHRRPRETLLHADGAPRVLTVYGGKLTAYRPTAAKVMARLAPRLPARAARADTARLELTPD